ncbi:unnamed protein product [Lupinus luteus]|uniref:Uncharacterized protein n=1 Tax=Lupinus luteus TaxID=3873 RepID=A0AAV1WKB7_LUPLU
MTHISDIKLIRTDTTLDLSQKAEKAVTNYNFFIDSSSEAHCHGVHNSGN